MTQMTEKKKPLIILTGPTAVGKTAASIGLAKAIGGEIISADSMQVYKHMDIGSAKIMPQEMDGVRHYLVDELEPFEEFHVVRFQEMARAAMKEIRSRGHIPILVGGTGFYIQAVVRDIDFTENEDHSGIREELEQLAAERGEEHLHQMLAQIDPESARAIHANNVKRVIRAIEYYRLTGEKISEHNKREREKTSPYDLYYYVLTRDRAALYERIEIMEEDGIPLVRKEAEALIEEAADRAEKPSLGKAIKGLFSSKYDKDGMLILKEEHFI